MGKYDGNYFEEMSKQRQKREENERREKHAQYISRRIPEDVINALESGKLKKEQIDEIERLPWEQLCTPPHINEAYAQKLLDERHVGLEDVKSRIMDYVYSDFRGGAALLLVGPPGAGKTSIAIQIARAIKRPWYEIPLSGIASAHEITGVDPTFSEAAPGEIVRAIKNTNSFYPLIILDEIDKVGRSTEHGDPQNALLEVLDTNRSSFRDRFLSIPIDLSNFVFIATANDLSDISPILRDRLEIIEIGGYNKEAKKAILSEQIIPQITTTIMDSPKQSIHIDDSAIESIVSKYSITPGIRELYDMTDRICRRANREYKTGHRKVNVTSNNLEAYLGKPKRLSFEREGIPIIGSANTAVLISTKYAKVIEIQAKVLEGNGTVICTGGIEGFAKEAVQIATSLIRYHSLELNISPEYFSHKDIHVHSEYHPLIKSNRCVSLAIFVAIISNIFKKKVPLRKMFVGELHLDGSIRYVSNIGDFLDAAIESNLGTAYISLDNITFDKDLIAKYKTQIEIRPLEKITQLIDLVLDKEKDGL